eukprot:PITA_32464
MSQSLVTQKEVIIDSGRLWRWRCMPSKGATLSSKAGSAQNRRVMDLQSMAGKNRSSKQVPQKKVEKPSSSEGAAAVTENLVCTGAKCEQHSKLAARKYARIIQKLGFPAQFKEFKIQNVVASCDVKFPIRLEGLAFSHGHFSSYEPELFPGLIYRMKQPKIVLLIFVSGKIVLTGAKVRDQIYEAFENIYPVLTEFRKIQQ